MAKREFGGPRFFALGAVWWFVVAGVMGLLHRIFPSLVETPLVVVIAVALALLGTFTIVYFARPK
jgi:succinate-acetate transporter protein